MTQLEILPTKKSHISFSELRDWCECSYRHYTKNVKGVNLDTESIPLVFGKAMHLVCELFLKTKIIDVEVAKKFLIEAFEKNKHIEEFTLNNLNKCINDIINISNELQQFMNSNFENWEFIAAEHLLYEQLDKYPFAFKGFIDGVVKVKNKKGKEIFWVLDWKTTSWGWSFKKKTNKITQMQLALYKHFYSEALKINFKDIRCAFVLLKRQAKINNHCQILKISVGETAIKNTLQILNNAILSIKKGIKIKNKTSCEYCKFKNTEYCT